MSRVPELNDECFVLSNAFFAEVSDTFNSEVGERPTMEEMCEILAWGLRTSGANIVSDVEVSRVKTVICKLAPERLGKLVPGDLLAVPGPDGKNYLAVFIIENRFGHAFGYFRGLWPARPVGEHVELIPMGRPIYTSILAVRDEGWRVVGKRDDLLKHFDADPEIFHAKSNHQHNNAIGEFGAAENAACRLRQLDRDEAQRMGLFDGSYRCGYFGECLQRLLSQWNSNI